MELTPEKILPEIAKMRFRELNPRMMQLVQDLVESSDYEVTITADTRLKFLVEIYRTYKIQETADKKSQQVLKKAESIVMAIVALHHPVYARESTRRQEELRQKFKPHLALVEGSLSISDKTRKLFASIGITDEVVVGKALGLFGEKEVENRVELVKISDLEHELVVKLFGSCPELILIPKNEAFATELENIERKKTVLDAWKQANKKKLPVWMDYKVIPEVLIDTYHDIERQLKIEVQEELVPDAIAIESRMPKYIPRPMTRREFIEIMKRLGYELERSKNESVFKRKDGRVLVTSNPHNGEYRPILVRKIISDIGMHPDEFEAARQQ